MKNKALGIIYIHSPRGIVINAVGKQIEVKRYENGGKYVRDGKYQVAYGSIPILNDTDIQHFLEVFC